jgi:prolyl-tRNA editing enzyme YbaK/EbsC (Cys-tRNA(Pro) deacylase)
MNANDLNQFIQRHQIDAHIIHLVMETPTVPAAAQALGVQPAQIIKSILFLADGRPCLIVANGLTRIHYKRLADHLGISRRRLKMADAAQVLNITGYPVGAVPPFGHKSPLPTTIEAGVLVQAELYGGGGEINALMRVTLTELRRVVGEDVAELTKMEIGD